MLTCGPLPRHGNSAVGGPISGSPVANNTEHNPPQSRLTKRLINGGYGCGGGR